MEKVIDKLTNAFPVGTSEEIKYDVIKKILQNVEKIKDNGIYYINEEIVQKMEFADMINIMRDKRKSFKKLENIESDAIKELEMLSEQNHNQIILTDYVQNDVLMWYIISTAKQN